MEIEDAIYSLLKNDAGVTAIVSGRVFGGVLPQTVSYPAVLYRAPGDGGRDVVRVLESGCALTRQRFHVFSAAKTSYGAAVLLDAAVTRCLDEYSGTVTDSASPPNSIEIQAIFAAQPAHAYQYDDKTQVHSFITEFEVHFLDPLKAD